MPIILFPHPFKFYFLFLSNGPTYYFNGPINNIIQKATAPDEKYSYIPDAFQ